MGSYSDEDADVRVLIQAGVYELIKHCERPPDPRSVDNGDESGNLTRIKVGQVPDDLQREADLPPTEAGGRPKDEAHMTEAEKQRRLQTGNQQTTEEGTTKSLDRPQFSKMVSNPVAKK